MEKLFIVILLFYYRGGEGSAMVTRWAAAAFGLVR